MQWLCIVFRLVSCLLSVLPGSCCHTVAYPRPSRAEPAHPAHPFILGLGPHVVKAHWQAICQKLIRRCRSLPLPTPVAMSWPGHVLRLPFPKNIPWRTEIEIPKPNYVRQLLDRERVRSMGNSTVDYSGLKWTRVASRRLELCRMWWMWGCQNMPPSRPAFRGDLFFKSLKCIRNLFVSVVCCFENASAGHFKEVCHWMPLRGFYLMNVYIRICQKFPKAFILRPNVTRTLIYWTNRTLK